MRRGALRDDAVGRQLAGFEQRHDLVVIGQLLRIHRLDDAGRKDLLGDPVFDVGDVVAVGLRHGALGGGVGIGRRHLQRDAEVFLALIGDGVEVRDAGAELAQRDRVLRPDGRKAGDGARTDGDADCGGAGLQERAA